MNTNMKSYYYACPVCMSKKNELCTQPTNNGRTYVKWVHFKRSDLALEEGNDDDQRTD